MEPLLTIPQVAQLLGVSDAVAYKWAGDGVLRKVVFGRMVRVDPKDLAAFIEDRKQGRLSDQGEERTPSATRTRNRERLRAQGRPLRRSLESSAERDGAAGRGGRIRPIAY